MGDPQKTALLTTLVDYILEHGMADMSLRPAAAIGSSPRMLLYSVKCLLICHLA
jgi:hypothetical protein